MVNEEIIKEYTGEESVKAFVDKNSKDFDKFFILDKSSNIKKGKLISCFKQDLRMLSENKAEEIYLFCKKKEERLDKNLKKTKCIDKPYFIFNFKEDNLFLYGSERLFFKSFKKYQREYLKKTNITILEKNEDNIKENFDEQKFIKGLFDLSKANNIQVYEILFNSLEVFSKKIRCQFSSELKRDDILELLSKEEIKKVFLNDLRISFINSISFKDKDENVETLKIREVEDRKIELIWKSHKFSELKKTLSDKFEIYQNKTIVYNYNGTLENLFREIEINNYKRTRLYNEVIKDYKNYIKISNNRPELELRFITKELKELLKKEYILENVSYSEARGLIFPSSRSKKRKKELIRIRDKKDKRIITYFYLNEKSLYEDKDKFLKNFIIFMPCLILDFRSRKQEEYYISCGEFIKKLKERDFNYFDNLIKKNNKDFVSNVESSAFSDLFNIIKTDIIPKFKNYNDKLGSQRKGQFYEKIVFILFSILFKVERIGGPNNHDGNIFIDNGTTLGYDAKNLEKNTLKSFMHKNKFKDKKYITDNKMKNYFFIFNSIEENFFKELVGKIKEDLKEEVFIKAIDLKFMEEILQNISTKGITNFNREDRQNLINKMLSKEDKIIR